MEFEVEELNWSKIEKDVFETFKTFAKLDYLFKKEHPKHLFTDQLNFLYILAPLSVEPCLGRHIEGAMMGSFHPQLGL